MKWVKITEVRYNDKNPRVIRDDKFAKLKRSIIEFPEMLEKRPLVCVTRDDGKLMVLGGNMRLKALNDIGAAEVPVILADDWTEEQRARFLIVDNVGFGEWDWEQLANEWDANQLSEWGLDLPLEKDDETYTTKIESPIYTPKEKNKPIISNLYDEKKYRQICKKIDDSKLLKEEKEFLKIAATRHIEFNYKQIAEYYSHSNKQTQEYFEDNALVIIDYGKAIEQGFVQLYNDLDLLLTENE